MAFKNTFRALGVALTTAFIVACGPSSASASISTIADYDAATQEDRNEYVADTLQRIYNMYNSSENTAHKASCMVDLYNQKNASGSPRILTLIINDLNIYREDSLQHKVEDVIFSITERECADYPRQQEAAKPTTQEPG